MSSTTTEVSLCGFVTKRCTSASLARSTIAAAGWPTSSSAPTPVWICERAVRSTAGSTASMSELASASVSLTKRRNALWAASSERRSSSWTHARALRSSLPVVSFVGLIGVLMVRAVYSAPIIRS